MELQAPLFDSLRKTGKIKVETLSASGKWFSNRFPVTPATAMTALTDYRNEGNKAAWYNSRFYRVNLLWKEKSFRFRDIHLFDERLVSPYLKTPGTSTQCIYRTLPVLDGFLWSDKSHLAGIRILQKDADGTMKEVICEKVEVKELSGNVLEAAWQTDGATSFRILFYEDRFEVVSSGNKKWLMEYTVAPGKQLPFTEINKQTVKARYNNFNYRIRCSAGNIKKGETSTSVFTIVPTANRIVVHCADR